MTTAKSLAANRPASTTATKSPSNKSILSFFKKVPPPEESMFVAGSGDVFSQQRSSEEDREDTTEPTEVRVEATEENSRYNECTVPFKRRRLSEEAVEEAVEERRTPPQTLTRPLPKPTRGPFMADSDDDEDGEDRNDTSDEKSNGNIDHQCPNSNEDALSTSPFRQCAIHTSFDETFQKVPTLDSVPPEKDITELGDDYTPDDAGFDFAGFENDENGIDDNYDSFGGEEFRERRYMETQAKLEACEVMAADSSFGGESVDGCPICGTSLSGNTPDQASMHVNACLDGLSSEPQPQEEKKEEKAEEASRAKAPPAEIPVSSLSARFMRTAQPRPGQANPVALGGTSANAVAGGASAFAALMSGKAEDAAWATAAASEIAARGRPAYERTCPFYKIMPGFNICVDAFRYGAVAGCQAYFLSHFHSDHYIGLTSKWCHGPIYCSSVTASLVRNQLGTAAQYVVALDFNAAPFEVPGTPGVRVTMIPANHCPGSSLFLFERTVAANGRTQRILHCGDFRACQAHVEHPQLKPDVLEHNKVRQQRIDVCYLDTTYLNPRYAFPPQDEVIAACASLCLSLSQSLHAGQEGEWGRALRRKDSKSDGSGNVKDFFAAAEEPAVDTSPGGAAAAPPTTALTALGKPPPRPNRLLVVCGTYSIGKERICKAIALALGSKIYATSHKIKIVAQLGDPELTALMTADPTKAQVHMQMLMELRAETLAEYLEGYRQHFTHIVGFRPSGWNYRPQGLSAVANLPPSTLATTTLLHGAAWRTHFSDRDLVPQRGSTSHAMCLGVPYSEHSSFRELALFLMSLRIDRVVPTVNVGSDVSRRRMKAWTDRWLAERRRGGIVQSRIKHGDDEDGKEKLWEGKDGQGGIAYW
ncbi:DNA cross-link repair protein PSO2/SNM1 [Sporothrix epigloea]|uniref:DNA cross-link repair protein PSO2/SNM1 n=1 Tax=Sporothrix epigloea TaxID=1892477 RepID=A0ABP0DWC7_9PEZI